MCFLRFMPKIVREFERAVTLNEATNLALVAQSFHIPLRLLLDFQNLPGRSGDTEFTNNVISGLRRLIKESTGHQKILCKYLERKAISHVNRKTRHVQRSELLTATTSKQQRRR